MSQRRAESTVKESTEYENLVEIVDDYEFGFQRPKPPKSSDYPFELKVHIWMPGYAQKFAETLNKRLSSDRKKFIYRESTPNKPPNGIFIEKRANPISKKTSHLSRIETRHWKHTVDFSQTGFVPYITFTLVFENAKQLK